MPQMSPMSWVLVILSLMFTILMLLNTFKALPNGKQKSPHFEKAQKMLKW